MGFNTFVHNIDFKPMQIAFTKVNLEISVSKLKSKVFTDQKHLWVATEIVEWTRCMIKVLISCRGPRLIIF